MKIVIQKKELENVLVKSIPFLESKDMSMITSNVLISLSDGVITVSSTDYEIGLKSTIQTMGIISDGTAIVNGKKLLDIIKILKNDNITIEAIEDTLHITQLRSKFKVALFADAEFPSFPSVTNVNEIAIDSNVLINAFREISPCIDTNNPKHEFNGALLDIKKDGIDFVATDIKRLSIVNVPNENGYELSIIIPRKSIIEIQKLFDDDIKIYCDDTYLVIESDNSFFFTKLVNGKFPDFRKIIPTDIQHNIPISKMLMIDSIKQINTVSNEVKIVISNNNILFSSVDDVNNNACVDINIDYECENDISIVFNSKFVLDFLSVIYDNEFNLCINEPNLPFILQSGDLRTVIMPVVL